jgi:hypothetical protein
MKQERYYNRPIYLTCCPAHMKFAGIPRKYIWLVKKMKTWREFFDHEKCETILELLFDNYLTHDWYLCHKNAVEEYKKYQIEISDLVGETNRKDEELYNELILHRIEKEIWKQNSDNLYNNFLKKRRMLKEKLYNNLRPWLFNSIPDLRLLSKLKRND